MLVCSLFMVIVFGCSNGSGGSSDDNQYPDTPSSSAVCGDNSIDPGEQCDDGNSTDGDGCSSTCTTEIVIPDPDPTTNYQPVTDPDYTEGPTAPTDLGPFNISGCTDLTSLDIQYDKRYGINRWPDYTIFGNYSNENVANPSSSSGTSNYWSASSSELKQWLVDGHPQWVWDFAFWQENHLLRTIAYNLGSRTATTGTNVSSGFGVGADGSSADTHIYRFTYGSWDYFYNQGSDEAYIIRPTGGLRDAFWRGATTFLNRYDVPQAEQTSREEWFNQLKYGRGTVQHINMLMYGAQFVAADNAAFQDKATEVVEEYMEDNFAGGMPCAPDYGNETSCSLPQTFMLSALHLETMRNYIFHWGDLDSGLTRMFGTYATEYLNLLPKLSDGATPDVGARWEKDMSCSFTNNQVDACSLSAGAEPTWSTEKPMIMSMLLIAHQFDPSIGVCAPASEALDDALDDLGSNVPIGWSKQAAQSMRDVVHGVALANTCSD